MTTITSFRVNGAAVDATAPANTPLLFVLRNDLGLRGTRFGCGEGTCGSCTVLVDGSAQTACNMAVSAVEGRHVETVESLARPGDRHPLLAAILAEQAGQCGYCLAGILMRAKALLAQTPRPTRSEVATALDGNLCRCGAHDRILRAVNRAAQAMADGGEP
ncbi:MAG: (2Fe-2S)-binding protein [Methyloligellaceae bacterium]